ncbi:toll/interleukin-1 receptor domain-containing protein [Gimesia chilikensis]|uniref:TIR domain protein n=1 Tax=Gimesia chilikensis TaxID=2605989 RepID=A0A517PYD6_9PLAN|nr:toll/interleukin-1 receptor domain-containing protein [Gimesia chilikensis]QDT24354.1 TIR domain protein [Gimesia chilikensis]
MDWDLFISHASEDKDEIVRPLANIFSANNVNVWYDEFEFEIGDNLRETIENGLRNSRYGLVVLSQHFFEKYWPKRELDGLITLETTGNDRILPIWHKVTAEDVKKHVLLLAGRYGLSTNEGLNVIADKISKKICTFRITDHFGRKEKRNISCCNYEGIPVIPAWLKTEPDRISCVWLLERLTKRAELRVFKDPFWGNGTWFVVDDIEGDGVVINEDQFNDLIPPSPTTPSPTTPPPTSYF